MSFDSVFLHIGGDVAVRIADIIGVFDLEGTTIGTDTREFLSQSQKENKVYTVSNFGEMPKSFVVCTDGVYICSVALTTLQRRLDG